jgi:DNA-binding beta-propeller fold protein YncE
MCMRVSLRSPVIRGLAACAAGLWPAVEVRAASVYSPHYVVSTYAGYAGQGAADGAGLTQAQFAYAQGVAVDAAGNRYVADTGNHTIRKITPAGVVSTLAGLAGAQGFRDGLGNEAWFNSPVGIAVSADGATVYVADTGNQVLRRVATATGAVTLVAGAVGESGVAVGTGTAARFNSPAGLVLAADGALYVADAGNHRVLKVVFSNGGTVGATTLLAGNTTTPAASIDGTGGAAKFNQPVALALSPAGADVYVAEAAGHVVRRITLANASVLTLAGAAATPGAADGTGGAGGTARFNKPSGLAVNPAGTELYVADRETAILRKIVLSSGAVSTVAGAVGALGSTSGAALAEARFRLPFGLAYDAVAGGVVVADSLNSQLRLYTPNTAAVSTLAGAPEAKNATDGPAASARFNTPAAVALHADGTLYVADRGNHVIRKITVGGMVSTLAGAAGVAGSVDGAGASARFNQPSAAVLNAAGTELFVADAGTDGVTDSGRVRRIILGGSDVTVSTLAGVFNEPRSLAFDPAGVLYVAETGAGALRSYATVNASPGTLAGGLNRPWGVVCDDAGSVYVAESYGHAIKKLTPGTPVQIAVFAGSVTAETGSSDATGTAATFFYPYGLARDTAGNLYVAEQVNQLVRRITPAGVVTTLAGSPQQAGFADSAAGSARLRDPLGLAVSPDGGTLYVADGDNQAVRKLALLPVPTLSSAATAAGTYGQAFTYNIQAAPAITGYGLTGSLPAGLQFDAFRGQITGTPSASGSCNVTVGATNASGTTSLNLAITIAKQPVTITLSDLSPRWDGTAQVPAAETSNGIHAVTFAYNGSATPPTKVGTYTVVATVNEANFTGTATAAFTVLPPEAYTVGTLPGGVGVTADALAVDGAGNVYIADAVAGVVRQLTPAGVLSDVAAIDAPAGIVATTNGTLYVAESGTGKILRITAGGQIQDVADGFPNPGALALSRDGTKVFFINSDDLGAYVRQIPLSGGAVTLLASWAQGLDDPRGLLEGPDGSLYVTDSSKNQIVKIAAGPADLSVYAGSETALSGSVDATGTAARFDTPHSLVFAADGALLVSDTANNTLRRIDLATAAVTTVAGLAGAAGDNVDGLGSVARLAGPRSLALRPDGAVVFADTTNNALRLATPPPIVPAITSASTAQATQGSAFTYATTATGTPTTFSAVGLPPGLSMGSGSGQITGTPTQSGVYNVTLTAGNAVGDGVATLVLTVAPPAYASWQTLYFTPTELAQTTLGATAADPDGDGYANFLEYALGSDPRSGTSRPSIEQAVSIGFLQISYIRLRAHSGLKFSPEVSVDLKTWQSGPSHTQDVSVSAMDATWERVVVKSLNPIQTTGRSFIRLRVEVLVP